MFYLPRICEHCLNPTCVSACPSGAIYKRAEDGIVLVDQDHCRGWRMCVSGCPYKKVFFNHHSGKARNAHCAIHGWKSDSQQCARKLALDDCATWGCSSTTPTTSPGPHLSPTHVPCTPPRETSSSTPTTPKSSHKPRPTASHTLGSKQPRRHRYGSSSAAIRLPYPCTLSTEHCRWSGTYHLCHQSSTLSALRATTGKITECCWPRFPRCAFRLSISPAYSLLEPRLQLSSHFVVWLQCAPTCETSFWGMKQTKRSPRQWT
ncbi:respiratory nitrate reductase beta chain [Cutibacterium acnes JCM 18916]|nr:respiratory nitrate reductase beta chain [Cutibacterium acnes JCM 18916]